MPHCANRRRRHHMCGPGPARPNPACRPACRPACAAGISLSASPQYYVPVNQGERDRAGIAATGVRWREAAQALPSPTLPSQPGPPAHRPGGPSCLLSAGRKPSMSVSYSRDRERRGGSPAAPGVQETCTPLLLRRQARPGPRRSTGPPHHM